MLAPEPNRDERLVEPLTRREREILVFLDEGFSAPEIAEQLTLAVSSVKWHIQQLYGKLGVSSKRQAITQARELGLLGGVADVGAGAAATAPAATAAAAAAPSPSIPIRSSEVPEPGESPFRGLRHFDEADAAWFFGREALAAKLAARLAAPDRPSAQFRARPTTGPSSPKLGITRFLAVVGASGSGKSSIVRAGLIPLLRSTDGQAPPFAPIHLLTPTAHPLEALAVGLTRAGESVTTTATLMDDLERDERALHLYARRLLTGPTGGRLLLIVDQFEELFTLCRGEAERQAFINNLLVAADPAAGGPVTVLITLRADFYPHCAAYAGLRAALADQQEYIGPMSADELRQAVERPARLGGWDFEPGLVDQILRDVGDEPGQLPLLSHALLETWRHRRGRTLTLRSYAEAGRVQGAIATTAEAVYQSLPPAEQAIARGIFLRLTELGEGTQDTRRRVPLAELDFGLDGPVVGRARNGPTGSAETAGGAVAAVLQTLSEARLITQDEGVVEVAHEALIREWPTLRQWLSEDREGLRVHRRLTEAAQEWEALERDPSDLYRGPRLGQALEWAAGHAGELNPFESEFLAAAQALVERAAAEHEARQQHELEAAQALAEAQGQRAEAETRRATEQAQAAGRLRARNRLITAAGVLALLAALAAGFFGLQSNQNAKAAQVANTQSAQNLSAAQAAGTQAIAQRDEAFRQSHLAFANQLAAQTISVLPTDYPLALLLAAEANRIGGSYLTRSMLHNALVYSPHLLGFLFGHTDAVESVAFSPDGQLLASASDDGTIRLWNVATHQPAGAAIPGGSQMLSLAFSPDGQTLAAGISNATVRLWDVAGGYWRGQPMANNPGSVFSLAFSPDGKQLAGGGTVESIYLWDMATGQRVGQPLTGHTNGVTRVSFSPDGKTLAGGSRDGTVQLWDAASDQPLGEPLTATAPNITSVAFSPDGKALAASSGSNGNVVVWDVAAKPPVLAASLSGHTANVTSVAFSPDGTVLASAGVDASVRLWNVAARSPAGAPLMGASGPLTAVAFSPDGRTLATASADQTVTLWQVSDSLLSLASEDPTERACRLAGRNLTHAEWNQYLTGQAYRTTCAQWPEGN